VHNGHPASVKIATFLSKPEALKFDIKADYCAFEIENKFVVGYGLDYDGLGRNLEDLYVLA
jgi:hypoxanthine phosphoribosyltransferase